MIDGLGAKVTASHAALAASDDMYRKVVEAGRHGGTYPVAPMAFGGDSVRGGLAALSIRDAALQFAQDRTMKARGRALVAVIIVAACCVLLVIVVTGVLLLLSRRIVSPVVAMTNVIDRLASGDHEVMLPRVARGDESAGW